MAFRRFKRFRSKGRFGGRRTSRLRRPSDGGRWERCYFYTSNAVSLGVPSEGDASLNFVINLASLQSVMGTAPEVFGIGASMRRMEIGGIVLHTDVELVTGVYADAPLPGDVGLSVIQCIATDSLQRTDPTLGPVPNCTACDWNVVQHPMAFAGTPGLSALEFSFPKQIHWRDVDSLNEGLIRYQNTDPLELHVPTQSQVRSVRRTISKRLKLTLGDQETLVYCFAIIAKEGYLDPQDVGMRATLTGTLYYRVRF